MSSPIVLRRLALAGAATGVAALSGCAAVGTSGPLTGSQPSPLAPVDVRQQFCVSTGGSSPESQKAPGEACNPFVAYSDPSEPRNERRFDADGSGRLLVAAEVLDGAPNPSFHLRRTPDVALVRDDAVLAEAGSPTPGHHWVGYRSAVVTYALGERNVGDVVEAAVPAVALGTAPVVTRLAVGNQVVQNGFGRDYGVRPVDCSERQANNPTNDPQVIDRISCPSSSRELSGTATDAQVVAPQAATATAGTTATLDFSVAQSGTVAEASALRVDASTTVGGGAAAPDTAEIPWAVTPPGGGAPGGGVEGRRARTSATAQRATVVGDDGVARTPVAVAVAVPDGTATGDYAVTLRVRDTAGFERTATAGLRVTGKPAAVPAPAPAAPAPAAPATPAPTAVLSTLKATKVNATRRRLHAGRVTCRSSTRCIVSTVVRADEKRVGFLRFMLKPGASGAVSLRLSRPATALLAKRGGTVTVSVDAGGPKTLVRITKLAVQQG